MHHTATRVTASQRSRVATAIIAVGSILGTILLLGASALWVHYGTAVFFETIASGIAACF